MFLKVVYIGVIGLEIIMFVIFLISCLGLEDNGFLIVNWFFFGGIGIIEFVSCR